MELNKYIMVCLLRLLCSEFFDIFNCWQEVTCYLNWCLVFVMYKPSINMNFNLNWSQVEVKLLTREIDVWFKRLSLYSQSLSTSLEAGLWGGLRYSYFTCIPVPYVADLLTMKNWAQTVTKRVWDNEVLMRLFILRRKEDWDKLPCILWENYNKL